MKSYLIVLALNAALLSLVAWALMLTVGILHGSWWPVIPTIGFWPSMAVSYLLGFLRIRFNHSLED